MMITSRKSLYGQPAPKDAGNIVLLLQSRT
jgi:hypothetical protein